MVPADSPITSAAEPTGKTIALPPEWGTSFRIPGGPSYLREELQAAGLDPNKDVTLTPMPWEALPKLNDYVAEGFKTGKFDAVGVTEPQPLLLREQKLARSVFTQTYQAPYNQEYCCLLGIKRAIVDGQPDKAALIVRAFRRAKQWTAQNPAKAVIAAQAAGYYGATIPVEPSASRVVSFGYDREVDLAQSLERSFKERIDAGTIKTDKNPKDLVRLHYRRME